jgi:hypothetical protein
VAAALAVAESLQHTTQHQEPPLVRSSGMVQQ